MTKLEVAEKIGNHWTKGEMDRIYFKLDELGVLKVRRYGTGRVAHAEWSDGSPISNGDADKLLNTKFWLDVPTEALCTKKDWAGADDGYIAKAVSMIEALLASECVTD